MRKEQAMIRVTSTINRSAQLRLLHCSPMLGQASRALGLVLLATSTCYAQYAGHVSGVGHSAVGQPTPSGGRRSAPAGIGIRGNGGMRVHATGSTTNSSAPIPTWELPRNITPHWEIPSTNNNIQPNDVRGNHVPHARGRYGVGYAAVPYIIDPNAFGDGTYADDGYADQQPSAAVNAGPPQYDPSLGGPEAPPQGPPARAPYVPQDTAVTSNPGPITNGLDHPEVTLVFNDGRAPMKVQSYAMTGAAVYVAENGHQQRIP